MGPPASYRVSRVRYYSGVIYVYPNFVYGSFTLFARLFQNRSTILLESFMMIRNPDNKLSVWPPSRSLAATWEIDVSFFSWGYLDVSVHPVSSYCAILFTQLYLHITTGGFPHSEICGSADICSFPQLIAACHVLHRLLVPRHPPYALFNLTSCLSFSRSASLPSLASVLTYLCTLRSSLLQRLAVREKSFAVLINFLLC